jgi:exoribonuclease-2
MLLAPRKGERFEGIVTGASPKGTWVRVFRPPAEGRVVRGEDGLDVGERVSVRLIDVNVERGFIDFARA